MLRLHSTVLVTVEGHGTRRELAGYAPVPCPGLSGAFPTETPPPASRPPARRSYEVYVAPSVCRQMSLPWSCRRISAFFRRHLHVGALKKGLRGRDFGRFDELQEAAGAWMRAMNARPNSVSGKRPDDLIADERRSPLPEAYPIAAWSEHRVRTDCHVQVRSNFYSVPHEYVGKRVVARVDASTVAVYVDFEVVARHERQIGRGRTVTDRQHYPEHKRKATQEIRRDRVDRIRSVGAGAAAFFAGLLAQREHVHSDAFRALMVLVEQTSPAVLDRACARAAHFGNFSLGALREIIDRKLYELPLDNFAPPAASDASTIVTYRPLEAYAMLLGGSSC